MRFWWIASSRLIMGRIYEYVTHKWMLPVDYICITCIATQSYRGYVTYWFAWEVYYRKRSQRNPHNQQSLCLIETKIRENGSLEMKWVICWELFKSLQQAIFYIWARGTIWILWWLSESRFVWSGEICVYFLTVSELTASNLQSVEP